jgi:hypothetical protein
MFWESGGRLCLQVFRSDVEDHRSFDYGYVGYSRSRLQIGSFVCRLGGEIESCRLRLNLHEATLAGEITTDSGVLSVEVFVHANEPIIHCSLQNGGSGEPNQWAWEPAEAKSTRPGIPATPELVERYKEEHRISSSVEVWEPNPPPQIERKGSIGISVQELVGGGQHAVAWHDENGLLCVSIGKQYPEGNVWFPGSLHSGREQAVRAIEKCLRETKEDISAWKTAHLSWWDGYYRRSFVSLPSPMIETVYWTQIYKVASATRGDHPMMDTAGPWQTPSPWPYITWNLNVQLCYIPLYVANRSNLAESLIRSLWTCRENLRKNIRPVEWQKDAYWLGLATGSDLDHPRDMDQRSLHCNAGSNLIWALHCVWLHYRHTMDPWILRERLYPLLRGAVTYSLRLLAEGDDGKLHFTESHSPEYGETTDSTYDLSLLRWGLETLISLAAAHEPEEPDRDLWRDTLERLCPLHTDDHGYMIGADTPFDRAHRHFSHLIQVYPLYTANISQPENVELIERSVDHFYRLNKQEYDRTGGWDVFAAYTHTGLASLSAALGRGNDALRHLEGFVHYRLVQPNSLYAEMGPCLESPLSAAQCVHDMLVQSWGGKIRIFPAMPDEWSEAVFHNLSAEGGFDVSAEWRDSQVQWVVIHSRAGEPCLVEGPFPPGMKLAVNGRPRPVQTDVDGGMDIALDRGDYAVIGLPGVEPRVAPLASDSAQQNWYGLNENRDRMIRQAQAPSR